MEYNFSHIEQKWKERWEKTNLYKVVEDNSKPKYYVLDMFPYPSGAGLHVGHPLGYVASDIYSRYKRLNGYNVLHPMGFDAFGLPAEQYAIETGQHPAVTTRKNIDYYRTQLKKIGFSFDWSRELETDNPEFYKWTQWIFMQLFKSWYNPQMNKAENIDSLIYLLQHEGNKKLVELDLCEELFSADDWKSKPESEQQKFLMKFRLAYLDYADVWWCEALGTVLANDEVKDGVSVRGWHPVEKIKMRQWFLRITAYADRLLNGLEKLDWSEAMKDMQRNWIGKSEGAVIKFEIADFVNRGKQNNSIEIFTTRPDTIYGATFIVLAPEHELAEKITSAQYKNAVEQYIQYVKSRSERDRISEVKKVTGQFTGAYAINPYTNTEIPVYIAEYVLAGYGTGAIMAVPGNDDRDYAFARKFNLPVTNVIDQSEYPNAVREDKKGTLINSGILNGMEVKDAIQKITDDIQKQKIGKRKINYRLRDAGFSRQRYWGEPFPVIYKNDIPYLTDEKDLPVLLPEVNSYKPEGTAKSPLAALKNWVNLPDGSKRETDTMPGYAGSSWYFYRYMDVHNQNEFASKEKINYWKNVDLYIGGTEHAVGHLLYSRMWNKFLFDMHFVVEDEPIKKLVNQGMIQGYTTILNRVFKTALTESLIIPTAIYVTAEIAEKINNKQIFSNDLQRLITQQYGKNSTELGESDGILTVGVTIPSGCKKEIINDPAIGILIEENLKNWRDEYKDCIVVKNADGNCIVSLFPEKMSKSKHNVVNPDDVIAGYGADCFRMYEMFLGPLDASKPWDTKGITGVSGFLRKVWRLFYDENNNLKIHTDSPVNDELKILHKTIKKTGDDIERLAFNTAVSAFMICVNELTELKCSKSEILKNLLIILSPFAPFITEELWEKLGEKESVHLATWPKYNDAFLNENTFNYPVSINGKTRTNIELPLDMPEKEIEKTVLALESVLKWTEGKQPKKIIIVKGKIVNVVV